MASILNLKGLTFPIKLEEKGTGVIESIYDPEGNYEGEREVMVQRPKIENYNDVLVSSLNNILLFPLGYRYYNPYFGTAIDTIMKEPNDVVLESLIKALVVNRVIELEPRVKVQYVVYTRNTNYGLGIDIKFEVPIDSKI